MEDMEIGGKRGFWSPTNCFASASSLSSTWSTPDRVSRASAAATEAGGVNLLKWALVLVLDRTKDEMVGVVAKDEGKKGLGDGWRALWAVGRMAWAVRGLTHCIFPAAALLAAFFARWRGELPTRTTLFYPSLWIRWLSNDTFWTGARAPERPNILLRDARAPSRPILFGPERPNIFLTRPARFHVWPRWTNVQVKGQLPFFFF